MQEIVLAPLGRADLTQLITDALRCEDERAAALALLIHEKTEGNPFFAISATMSYKIVKWRAASTRGHYWFAVAR